MMQRAFILCHVDYLRLSDCGCDETHYSILLCILKANDVYPFRVAETKYSSLARTDSGGLSNCNGGAIARTETKNQQEPSSNGGVKSTGPPMPATSQTIHALTIASNNDPPPKFLQKTVT